MFEMSTGEESIQNMSENIVSEEQHENVEVELTNTATDEQSQQEQEQEKQPEQKDETIQGGESGSVDVVAEAYLQDDANREEKSDEPGLDINVQEAEPITEKYEDGQLVQDVNVENIKEEHSEEINSTEYQRNNNMGSGRDTSIDTAGKNAATLENVDYELLQKQVKYIMDSDMLNIASFKESSKEQKITAIMNFINSNPETALFPSLPSVSPKEYLHESAPQRELSDSEKRRLHPRTELSMPMTQNERERYAEYLRGENKITEMSNLPPKSRLFIGNLPLKNVSKEDLFRIFSPYGRIVQINIKNAFGFIQFKNPQSVRDAIECESNESNFGKKLILEVSSSNSRPQFDHGDHGTNSSSTFISTSKRPFHNDEEDSTDMYSDSGFKKSKRHVPSCVIYVKRTADRNYANEVFNQFKHGTGLETDMMFLKPRMEIRRMINEVAHDGVWGVVLVNKTRNVDVQTFYKGPQGETKFDEYISISSDDAVAIFKNLKSTRMAGNHGMAPMGGNQYVQAPMAPPAQQAYNQQPPYGMSPQNQAYGVPPPQQAYVQQPPYGMPPQNQAYGVSPPQPQQMQQGYGRYQGSSAVPQQQPQLSSLLGGNVGQMDQNQLLAAIQNLPPAVVSNLLSMSQQQQQQSQGQQQLVGLIQSIQGNQPQLTTQLPQQNYGSREASINNAYPPQGVPNHPPQDSNEHMQAQPVQQQSDPTVTNNVQSLLNSLAKLQK